MAWKALSYGLVEYKKKGDASLNACAHCRASAAAPRYGASIILVVILGVVWVLMAAIVYLRYLFAL